MCDGFVQCLCTLGVEDIHSVRRYLQHASPWCLHSPSEYEVSGLLKGVTRFSSCELAFSLFYREITCCLRCYLGVNGYNIPIVYLSGPRSSQILSVEDFETGFCKL
jgi:hypothetical protein